MVLNFFWKNCTIIAEAIKVVRQSETPQVASQSLRRNVGRIRSNLAASKLSLSHVMTYFNIQVSTVTQRFDVTQANNTTRDYLIANPPPVSTGNDVVTYRNWAVLCGLRDLTGKLCIEAGNLLDD